MEAMGEDQQRDPFLPVALALRMFIASCCCGLLVAVYVPVKSLRKLFPDVNNGKEKHLLVEAVSILQALSSRIKEMWTFVTGLLRIDAKDEKSLDKFAVIYWVVLSQLFWSMVQVGFYFRYNSVLSALEAKDKALLYQEAFIQALIAALQQVAWGVQHIAIHRAEAMFNVHVSTKLVRAYLKRKLFYGNGTDTKHQLVILNDMQRFSGSLFKALTTILFPLFRLVLVYNFIAPITPKLQVLLISFSLYVMGIVVFSWWDYDSLDRTVTTARSNLGASLNGIEENAEALLFYQGEVVEEYRVMQLARKVADAVYTLKATMFKNGVFTWVNEELIQLLPYVLFSSEYFAGKIDLGGLIFIQHMCFYTFYVTNGIPGNIQTLKAVFVSGSNVKRVIQGPVPQLLNVERIEPPPPGEPVIVVEDLKVKFRKPLNGVSFQVNRGDKVLIEGGNGEGKTTIFRALAELLEDTKAQGKLRSISRDRSVFVPQNPYNVRGASLRDQVLFPRWNQSTADRPTDEQIQQALDKLQIWDRLSQPPETKGNNEPTAEPEEEDLDKRINRFLKRMDWNPLAASAGIMSSAVDRWFRDGIWNTQTEKRTRKRSKRKRRSHESKYDDSPRQISKTLDQVIDLSTLSGGERQLLGLARVLLILESLREVYGDRDGAAIAVLYLDEATSQLHAKTEEAVYSLLVEECETLVSIGHRKTLRKFHDYKYQLDEGLVHRQEL